jgi:hypothetical protein
MASSSYNEGIKMSSYFCTSIWCLTKAGKSLNNARGVEKDNPITAKGSAVKYCPDCNSILRQGFVNRFCGKTLTRKHKDYSNLERRK